ncbi:MAG: hypothetical protein ACLR17_06520 [Enterobacteriaceae bacterium]
MAEEDNLNVIFMVTGRNNAGSGQNVGMAFAELNTGTREQNRRLSRGRTGILKTPGWPHQRHVAAYRTRTQAVERL